MARVDRIKTYTLAPGTLTDGEWEAMIDALARDVSDKDALVIPGIVGVGSVLVTVEEDEPVDPDVVALAVGRAVVGSVGLAMRRDIPVGDSVNLEGVIRAAYHAAGGEVDEPEGVTPDADELAHMEATEALDPGHESYPGADGPIEHRRSNGGAAGTLDDPSKS